MGNRTENFSNEKYKSPINILKLFNMLSQQWNESHNYNEVPPYHSENGCYKENK
jgi:hypothetical protein